MNTKIRSPIFICLFLLASLAAATSGGSEMYFQYFSAKILDLPEIINNPKAKERAQNLKKVMDVNLGTDIDEKLYEVNSFFNSIPYVSDLDLWGKSDYWATPFQMILKNAGDCEDYVIAKYFALRGLGIPDSRLRMMFVTALSVNQAHMVLAYYPEPNAIPLILDNINPRILPANKRRDLLPVYSFNGEGLWLAKAQGRGSKLGSSKHKLWDDLTARIERDF